MKNHERFVIKPHFEVRQTLIWLALALLMLWQNSAQAQSWEALQAWLAAHPHISAQFVQRSEKASAAMTLPPQQGKLWLKLPHRLRWEVLAADGAVKSLLLVSADLAETWSYDPDLQQAIHQPLRAMGGASPAEILLNLGRKDGLAALKKQFNLSEQKDAEGLWLTATPLKSADHNSATSAPFQWLQLNLTAAGLQAIRIRDLLDQVITIKLSALTYPASFAENWFTFVPPPGVDVLDQMKSP